MEISDGLKHSDRSLADLGFGAESRQEMLRAVSETWGWVDHYKQSQGQVIVVMPAHWTTALLSRMAQFPMSAMIKCFLAIGGGLEALRTAFKIYFSTFDTSFNHVYEAQTHFDCLLSIISRPSLFPA